MTLGVSTSTALNSIKTNLQPRVFAPLVQAGLHITVHPRVAGTGRVSQPPRRGSCWCEDRKSQHFWAPRSPASVLAASHQAGLRAPRGSRGAGPATWASPRELSLLPLVSDSVDQPCSAQAHCTSKNQGGARSAPDLKLALGGVSFSCTQISFSGRALIGKGACHSGAPCPGFHWGLRRSRP